MGLLLQSALTEALIFIATLIAVITGYYHSAYQYWLKKGIPVIPPRFPLGNNNIILARGFTVGSITKSFYDYFRARGHKFGGVYLVTEPNLVIIDPDLIKHILCKDFQHFVDRGFYFNQKHDPLSANIFTIDGLDWKNLRIKLTPTFTSSKMKMMFHTMVTSSDNMVQAMRNNLETDIDVKEMLGRYTTDVIGSCAFGIECNSFKNPDAEFRRMGKKIFEFDFWRSIRAFLIGNLPKLSLQLGLRSNNKDVRDFFTKVVADTMKMRKDSNCKRDDFLQILIDLEETTKFSLNEIAAQAFLFFLAGFETSATTMTLALYELASNSEVQKKLREEICLVLKKHHDQITYESLLEMRYLGQVFQETLRKYPPGMVLNRRCNKEFVLPNTNVVVQQGTPILIPVLGLHRDPDYYPEPEKFNPERFSDENQKDRHPFVYLPFGDGPRNCIGQRFGSLQSKIGIVNVIKNFQLSVSPITKEFELDAHTFILSTVNTIYLKAEAIGADLL